MEGEGIYLLREREFIRLNEEIYKIGRSKHIKTRMNSYPKGSVIELMIGCSNSIQCEKDLLAIFRNKYIEHKEYGAEYFEGNKLDMINTITTYLNTLINDNVSINKKLLETQLHMSNEVINYPDSPPKLDNLEIIELNYTDFYMDITNNNVYQIINGDDIGVFLGVYDKTINKIISYDLQQKNIKSARINKSITYRTLPGIIEQTKNIPITEKDTTARIKSVSCSLYTEQPAELHINDMKIIENAGCLFWMDKNNYNMYEITSDNGIGSCVGKYDNKRKCIIA
jgi:hypothetical protein